MTADDEYAGLVRRLVEEYDGRLPAQAVIHCVETARSGVDLLGADAADGLRTVEVAARNNLEVLASTADQRTD